MNTAEDNELYLCVMSKKELDNSPVSPILKQSEISSFYTNGQTYLHIRQDRFVKLGEHPLFKSGKLFD